MSYRDIPLVEEVASRLHQWKVKSVSGPGRRPDSLKKSWEDLSDEKKDEYYREIEGVVLALRESGFIVDLASQYQILARRTNPLKVAIKKSSGTITIKE